MQISPISLTSFKGNQQVIDLEDNEYQINDIFEEDLQDEFANSSNESEETNLETKSDKMSKVLTNIEKKVESGDLKGPGAIIASVGVAVAKTFINTAATAGVIAGAVDFATKNKLTKVTEKGLKQVSKGALWFSEKLAQPNKGILNVFSNIIKVTDSSAKKAYKSLANSKFKPVAVIAGAISTLAFVPALLKTDGNEDGVADIMQKSQNVYKANNEKCSQAMETIGIVKDIMEILT